MKKIALSIRPFTRIVWRSNEIKGEWEPKLRRASRVYNEAEWRTVAEGHRKACTVHMSRGNFETLAERLTKDGMFFMPLHRTAKYSGFSHTHIEPKEGEDYDVYGVAAKDPEICERFKKADKGGTSVEHSKIGELLDYPECCRRAFKRRWGKGIIDPMFEAAKAVDGAAKEGNTEAIELDDLPPETNQMLRYFGVRMTSHLPCSFRCEETIEGAGYWKEVMKDADLGGYNYLGEILDLDLRWDAYRGIVEVTTPLFRGITTTGFTWGKRVIRKGNLDW